MRKRINYHYLFQGVFFLGLSAFLFNMLLKREFLKYIHVKFKPLLIGALALVLILSIVSFLNIFNRKNRSASISFIYLLLPLLIYSYPKKSARVVPAVKPAIGATESNDNMGHTEISKNGDLYSDDMLKKAIEEASKMDMEGEKKVPDFRNITEDNFFDSVEYIYSNPGLEGETIEIKGLLLKFDDSVPKPYFVGRMLMFCCAADAMPMGFFIDNPNDLKDYDGWVTVKGKLHFVDGESAHVYIEVGEIKEAPEDEIIYVYPTFPVDVEGF